MSADKVFRFILATIVLMEFGAGLAFMLWKEMTGSEILIGGLNLQMGIVIGYWFTSNSGSDRKTELLAGATPDSNGKTKVTKEKEIDKEVIL